MTKVNKTLAYANGPLTKVNVIVTTESSGEENMATVVRKTFPHGSIFMRPYRSVNENLYVQCILKRKAKGRPYEFALTDKDIELLMAEFTLLKLEGKS